jgi:hypothetical protein
MNIAQINTSALFIMVPVKRFHLICLYPLVAGSQWISRNQSHFSRLSSHFHPFDFDHQFFFGFGIIHANIMVPFKIVTHKKAEEKTARAFGRGKFLYVNIAVNYGGQNKNYQFNAAINEMQKFGGAII